MGREQSVFAIIYKYILESAAITFFFLKSTKRRTGNQYTLHIPSICLFRKISSVESLALSVMFEMALLKSATAITVPSPR